MLDEDKRFQNDLRLLKDLESRANKGRGVVCVKAVISFLERGERDSAENVVYNEWDKILNYYYIAELLEEMGLVSGPPSI